MSIAKDTGYNLASALAPALLGLVVTPIYLRAIGPERFGILAICWTIVSALGWASLGMGPSLSYRLASGLASTDVERSRITWTAIILALTSSLVGAMLVVGIGETYFRHFFSGGSALDREIWAALPLLAALFPVSVMIGVLNGALQGMRRFGTMTVLSITGSALLILGPMACALIVDPRLPTLVLATLGANIMIAVLELAICSRLVPLQAPVQLQRSDVNALLGYGAWMSATALFAPIVMLLDRFIIGALRGPLSVAVFVLPYNLVQQLVFVPSSLTSAIMPRLAAVSDAEARELQGVSLAWLNGLLTPASLAAIALAGPFLTFWIGPALGSPASLVAVILLVGFWMHGIGYIPSTVVVARSRPDLLTKLLIGYVIPYVVILYFLTLRFGVIGAAASWTIRSAFDPLLFFFTSPRRSDMLPLLPSTILLLSAMVTALCLSWTSLSYWALNCMFVVVACYQSRAVLVACLGKLRVLTFGTS